VTSLPATAAQRAGRARPPTQAQAQAGFRASLAAVYTGQLSRARVTRAPLLVVATMQSVGLVVLLRGVRTATGDLTATSIVAGATVLVIAFVALNLLAQRIGALRASGLDYYAALGVQPVALMLGIAAAYSTFTVPGTVVTAVVGGLIYGVPLGQLWVLAPVIVVSGAALAGLGTILGLVAPKPELATVLGQLGMSAVLFIGVIPAHRWPQSVRWLRDVLPSTFGVDALGGALRAHPDWGTVTVNLALGAGVACALLAIATVVYRRVVMR
jgi:ABC-2 type transport system permease protein